MICHLETEWCISTGFTSSGYLPEKEKEKNLRVAGQCTEKQRGSYANSDTWFVSRNFLVLKRIV